MPFEVPGSFEEDSMKIYREISLKDGTKFTVEEEIVEKKEERSELSLLLILFSFPVVMGVLDKLFS